MIDKNDFLSVCKANLLEIKATEYFDKINPPSLIGNTNSSQIKDSFELAIKDFCGPYEHMGGWIIIFVEDKKPSFIPENEEIVKDKVIKAYKEKHAPELAKSKAIEVRQKLLALLNNKTFEEASKDLAMKVYLSGMITMTTKMISGLGFEPDIVNQIFKLKEDEISEIFTTKDKKNYVIGQISKREPADMAKLEKDKEKYKKSTLENKKQEYFSNWLENLRKEANIKILQKT